MIYYEFDPCEKAFCYKGKKQIDPLETKNAGKIVYSGLGKNQTTVKPPNYKKNEIPVWTGESWEIVKDYRNETWYDSEGVPHLITKVGQPDSKLSRKFIAPKPTADDVNFERDKRIRSEFEYKGHYFQLDDRSKLRMNATYLKCLRDDTLVINWISSDNSVVEFNAKEFMDMVDASTEFEKNMVLKAKEIKSKRISRNFKKNKYWK